MPKNTHWKNTLMRAVQRYREGQLDQAEAGAREALGLVPRNPDALRLLGMISSQKGHYVNAIKFLRKAVKFDPKSALAHNDLAKGMHAQGAHQLAIDAFKRAIALDPKLTDAHLYLGHALRASRRDKAAIKAYQKAIQLAPDLFLAYLFLGHTLLGLGRMEAAIKAYKQALSLKPDEGATYWALANSNGYSFTISEIEHMRVLIESGSLSQSSEIPLCFALARCYEESKDYDLAFDFLQRGNRAQRSLVQYDIAAEETLAEQIIHIFDSGLFQSKQAVGHPSVAPIFLISLPRSGSTLIEQILASHSQVVGGDETNASSAMIADLSKGGKHPADFFERLAGVGGKKLHKLGQDYLNKTREYGTNTPYFTDKSLNNFSLVGFLHLILPKAKFIHCYRDPVDTCLSCYKQLFAIGQHFSYDLEELGGAYRVYDRLMRHWHTLLSDQILRVQYEDLVANQEVVTRKILDFLELPWEDTCLSFHKNPRTVRTVSAGQVRQPVYATAIKRWKHYEQHLRPLLDSLRRPPALID